MSGLILILSSLSQIYPTHTEFWSSGLGLNWFFHKKPSQPAFFCLAKNFSIDPKIRWCLKRGQEWQKRNCLKRKLFFSKTMPYFWALFSQHAEMQFLIVIFGFIVIALYNIIFFYLEKSEQKADFSSFLYPLHLIQLECPRQFDQSEFRKKGSYFFPWPCIFSQWALFSSEFFSPNPHENSHIQPRA